MEIEDTKDEELILRYYQGDAEALKVVFKRYKDSLFNFALRFAGNRADAEDAVSHAFMTVCERRYTIKPGASFKTWLFTVTRNICISKIRGRSKSYSLQTDAIDQKANSRDELNQKEIMAIIQHAVHQLPGEQKEALLLREYQGFTYEEIAQVLDCSLEKVKVLIFRARNHLKDVLPPVLLEEGR